VGTAVELTGHTFGLLRVLERSGSDEANRATWRCECACHEIVIARGSDLREGTKRRCSPDCQIKQERPVFRVTVIGVQSHHISGRASDQHKGVSSQ
jgi:hypothetical protein